ncbi:TatD family hydrolase [Candidatus Micrarchaeota archaeon]|nr:TatD family hydrolase [Candidatus Micrarchaeota archaeon]
MMIDSHCHLYDLKNYILPDDIYPVVVGYSYSSNKKAVDIAKGKYPFVLGIAPQSAIKHGTEKLEEWVDFIRENKPCAIGEIGLDYKWAETMDNVNAEKKVFSRMIELADELKVPLVIHSRNNPNDNDLPKNAVEDILEMIGKRKALMHFYSGSAELAKKIVDNGGYISIIHLHSKERRKVINTIPLERLLVESDSPFVGRTPEVIREAIDYISEVKQISREEVARKTAKNAMEFFGFEV